MWVRTVIGVILCIAGAVWILQGINVIHGSTMSGHGGYGVLGAVVLVLGVLLVGVARRRLHR